ncbi:MULTISPECIES: toxin-antitoxin system YwqK family antitoxin [Heyndrickxia]|uniref:Uncharacterized protein n=1 Tax=Heyndrickxia sporothermodurans TaxID=46224 RepID=A0AB37HES2_9BACI|nr:hypothetical protein [Heyndrickxia sporothermodurans]MBL5769225.1 hypothetical protein [Heyndrickxia sporothermodurans]MBL5772994.1 hypothetical protein [Heyndrickxia sporothermodurans]MBL5776456.1 hypothetical protein [Heyndrickxia sporothermodurans]MBL5787097.1 hypothetical protein [Heyndrickxia sporothermodurans]MBL5790666.1 hypothetical protein [Heyndrickxia sporothermodurans]
MPNDILTKEYIIQHGVEFETNLDFGGPYEQGIVEYDQNDNENLFTGLAYDLYDNGNLESYFFVENGVKQGAYVEFYPNGNIKRVGNMDKSASEGEQIEYYENGQLKSITNRIAGRAMTYKRFDEQGVLIDEKIEPTESDLIYAKKFG